MSSCRDKISLSALRKKSRHVRSEIGAKGISSLFLILHLPYRLDLAHDIAVKGKCHVAEHPEHENLETGDYEKNRENAQRYMINLVVTIRKSHTIR